MLLIGLSELKWVFVYNSFSVVLRNSKQNENLLSEVHGSCILIIFYQVGFVLYPPTDAHEWQWNPNEHNQIMVITSSFMWHWRQLTLAMAWLLSDHWFTISGSFLLAGASASCANRAGVFLFFLDHSISPVSSGSLKLCFIFGSITCLRRKFSYSAVLSW